MAKDKGKDTMGKTEESLGVSIEGEDTIYYDMTAVPPLDKREEVVGTTPVVSFVQTADTISVIRDCNYSIGAKGPDGKALLDASGKRVKSSERRVRLIVTVPRSWVGNDPAATRALLRLVSAQISILPRKSLAWGQSDVWTVDASDLLTLSKPSGKRADKTPEERQQIAKKTRETATAKTLAATYGIPENTVRELLASGGIRAVVDYVAKL